MYKTNALSVDILTFLRLTNHKSGPDVCVCVCGVCVCVVCVYKHTRARINLIDPLLRIIATERLKKSRFHWICTP